MGSQRLPLQNVDLVRRPCYFLTSLNRGRRVGSAESNAFERKMRAPSDRKQARSWFVKNELPSRRGWNSRSKRPLRLINRVRTSLIKNFQSAGVHSIHSPFSAREIR